jgi:hypothetical protein
MFAPLPLVGGVILDPLTRRRTAIAHQVVPSPPQSR